MDDLTPDQWHMNMSHSRRGSDIAKMSKRSQESLI